MDEDEEEEDEEGGGKRAGPGPGPGGPGGKEGSIGPTTAATAALTPACMTGDVDPPAAATVLVINSSADFMEAAIVAVGGIIGPTPTTFLFFFLSPSFPSGLVDNDDADK